MIGAWFYEGLAGIRPDWNHPGFKHFTIRSDWSRKDGVLTMEVTVPVNTTATVFIPGEDITEGGVPATKAKGVTLLRREGGRQVFALESGAYRFEAEE